MSEQPAAVEDSENAVVGPGAELTRAREALRLSRREVADNLRLAEELIVALEEDDFGNLPAPIYVHGYLRNYARLLNIAPEPLIEGFGRAAEAPTPPIVSKLVRHQGVPSSRAVTWFAVVIVVLTGAGFFAWWQGADFVGLVPVAEHSRDAAPESPLMSDDRSAVEIAAAEVAADEKPTGKPAAKPVVRSAVKTQAEPASKPPAGKAGTKAPVETVADKTPVPAPVKIESQAADPAPAAEPAPAPEITQVRESGGNAGGHATTEPDDVQPLFLASADVLTLHLREDSWVEVDDAGGQRLIYDLLHEGSAKTVYGTAPFSVFLGNAKAVAIELNQRKIDHSPHVRGNLARFSVAAKQAQAGDTESSSN